MSKRVTVNDVNKAKFYQLPKAFFHNPTYTEMKNESKLMYSILRDLLDLSIKNNWVNEKGEIYVKLSREKMMKRLNIKGKQKITQIVNELKNKELIEEVQIGVNKCNEIYVCIPDDLDLIYNDEELLESEMNTLTFENQTSRGLKIKSQEVRKSNFKRFENQTHINTNNTNTKKTNTNYKNCGKKEIPFVDNCEIREEYSDPNYLKDIENRLLPKVDEEKESEAEKLLEQFKK